MKVSAWDTFGLFVRFARGKRTLRAFATTLGCSASFLCDVERGRRKVSLGEAVRWAPYLGRPELAVVESVLAESLRDDLLAAGLPYTVDVTIARSPQR